MKRVEKCVTEDCIPTPSCCVKWNGGDLPFLEVCEGDCINPIFEEIVTKLQKIAGDKLKDFTIEDLLKICGKEAPEEITIISILTLLRDNQLCMKDFLDELDGRLAELLKNTGVKVNLKCYTGFNNIGLSITRDQFDQLIIDVLCNHENALDSIDATIARLHEEINAKALDKTIEEAQVATCVNTESLPLSIQVQNTSKQLCDFELATGSVADINKALALTPTTLNAEFGGIIGWILNPINWAEFYNNTLLEVENLRKRLITIEEVCCAVTCDDVTIGFTAVMNEDNTGIIITFSAGAGMVFPEGFEDCGSTGTITDIHGDTQDFTIAVAMNTSTEIPLEGLLSTSDLDVSILAQVCNEDEGIQCNKCVSGTVSRDDCEFCVLTATGNVTITYKVCTTI